MNVERFTFYSMQERKPPYGIPVLVKFYEYARMRMNMPNYYVCCYLPGDPDKLQEDIFCEAGGEEYWKFEPEVVAGWASIGMETWRNFRM